MYNEWLVSTNDRVNSMKENQHEQFSDMKWLSSHWRRFTYQLITISLALIHDVFNYMIIWTLMFLFIQNNFNYVSRWSICVDNHNCIRIISISDHAGIPSVRVPCNGVPWRKTCCGSAPGEGNWGGSWRECLKYKLFHLISYCVSWEFNMK